MRMVALIGVFLLAAALPAYAADAPASVERWGTWELALPGPSEGNPFLDVSLSATFRHDQKSITVTGFYDGHGTYRLRFMPPDLGPWTCQTASNRPVLHGVQAAFTCTPPTGANHGPVAVNNNFHFAYADGSRYIPVGTTCYAWTHQGDALETQTLQTLKASPFNKLRMCVFPKHYAYNNNEPVFYPFEGTPPKNWDFTRFNPAFFQHLEQRIAQLRDLGIEADLILFHPYDKGQWGFDRMHADVDDRYVRYLVARLAAYRNVWWSLANEWDFIKEKKESDFDRLFQVVQSADSSAHLRSIHNGSILYDHNKPWVTHASIQNGFAVEELGRAGFYRDAFRKPIVYDEVKYEGDFDQRWGNLSAEEMVHRCWVGTIAGTYVGHGETYKSPDEIVWWSKGGLLKGQSPARLAFLRRILEEAPNDLDPIDNWQDPCTAGKLGAFYLVALGRNKPTEWIVELPKKGLNPGTRLKVDILDTWNMTVTPVEGAIILQPLDNYRLRADRAIPLPGKAGLVLRVRRESEQHKLQ